MVIIQYHRSRGHQRLMSLHPPLIAQRLALIHGIHLPSLLYVVPFILVVHELRDIAAVLVSLVLLGVAPHVVSRDAEASFFIGSVAHHLVLELLQRLVFHFVLDCALVVCVTAVSSFFELFDDAKLAEIQRTVTFLLVEVLVVARGFVAITFCTLVGVNVGKLVWEVRITLPGSLFFFD
jgi:hypothetical protein